MIGIGLSMTIKKSAVITDTARTIAMPLVQVTQMLAARILARIRRGQGPDGPWDTYSDAVTREAFWVQPTRKQPGTPGEGAFRFRVASGKWAGWAVYESVAEYNKLAGKSGQPHDFDETGELLSKAVVRIMSARHVRLAFYGGHKSGLSAKQLAWRVSQDERQPMLMPSRSEVQEAQAYIAKHVNEAFVRGARLSESAQRLTAASRSVKRRTSRLLGG